MGESCQHENGALTEIPAFAGTTKWRAVSSTLFRNMNTPLSQPDLRDEAPDSLMHREEAAASGVADKETATLTGRHDAVDVTVKCTEDIARGMESLTRGFSEPNVNKLISQTDGVDRLTGMPRLPGIAVTVAKVGGGHTKKENREPMDREIIVYSTPLCAPCESLKNHLRTAGIAFIVKDVLMDEEAGEFLESRGIFTTPVLSVNGELLEGFKPDKVNDLLGIRQSAGPVGNV